tara:strand:+ start:74 stop:655 length:582 start_codon:yes stop_codon:yes gene_type:complete
MIKDYSIILDIFLNHIIPLTKKNIIKGNKIFGAAILKKTDLSILTIGVNNEVSNPLFHGEISTLNNFFENNINYNIKDCIFLSTHEPCSLCLSAITWSGFDNFYYFFPYEDTHNKFNIPHDLKILKEVFRINDGNYNNTNIFWKSYSILDEIKNLSKQKQINLKKKIDKIIKEYDGMSKNYQLLKNNNNIFLN